MEGSTNIKRSGPKHSRGGARGGTKSRGARGGRNKRSDMGRAEWSRNNLDKRARHEENQQAAKRQRLDGQDPVLPIYATQFTEEEIASEPKRPKKKVAVMLGYSGSGYKGMQLNHNERTIEGDLFKAFVEAGAISKANADDPKKSALIRCARTDKGVHAAGNLVSLKLIVEDSEIVSKINEKLSPQIRVFGIERTNGSFSAYQFCDSRIYEYLIPTHCFLPPHPSSYLGKKLVELAEEAKDLEGFKERQDEVSSYWADTEEEYIRPALESIDPSIRSLVLKALYDVNIKEVEKEAVKNSEQQDGSSEDPSSKAEEKSSANLESRSARNGHGEEGTKSPEKLDRNPENIDGNGRHTPAPTAIDPSGSKLNNTEKNQLPSSGITNTCSEPEDRGASETKIENDSAETVPKQLSPLEDAVRHLRAAYIGAKRAYRIHPRRLERVRSALSRYLGTQNFHNYTVEKSFRDASAKRVIKSFVVASDPIIIGDTEWLSLKVHGQSFMMHQIRKMVSMAALVVRCGCHEGRIQDSYMADKVSIPKAPGLGLLLERPVFDTYNERLVGQYERQPIDFKKYEIEMEDFKQKEIYQRIYREEDEGNTFHSFFAAIDNLKSSRLLYLSSAGLAATKEDNASSTIADDVTIVEAESDDDGTVHEDNGDEEDPK